MSMWWYQVGSGGADGDRWRNVSTCMRTPASHWHWRFPPTSRTTDRETEHVRDQKCINVRPQNSQRRPARARPTHKRESRHDAVQQSKFCGPKLQILKAKSPLSVFPRLLARALTPAPSRLLFPSLNAKSLGTPSIERLRAKSIRISVSPLTENPAPVAGPKSAGRAAVHAMASCDARARDP